MLKSAPAPVDVQDLQFKLHCRLKVFDNVNTTNFARHCSLVACASRFGLIFIGTNTSSIQVIQLKDVEKYTTSDGDRVDYPRRNIRLPSSPSHVSVNCEHTLLAVVIEKNNCPHALFFNVETFYQQDVNAFSEVPLSPTPGVHITEVNWNPALANTFTACKSDGSLGIYEFKPSGVYIIQLPAAAGATCFCWSPKGKQIAVGSRDGKITQLKPDLKAVKVINAPPLNVPHILQSLQWVSNYQFIGVFQPITPESPAVFIVVDTPKTGDPTYINYDDICYSNGCARPVQFYTILLHSWNVLMAASSNSMEVGILGNSGDCWTQWSMGDAARAELPLSHNRQETLPIGCSLDIGSTQPLSWGESTLPPTPLLLLYSNHGTLCFFNVVNLKQGIPSICSPPDAIKHTSGLFISSGSGTSTEQKPFKENVPKEVPKVAPAPQITPQLPLAENQKVAPSPSTISMAPNPSTLFKVQPQPPTVPQGLNLSKAQPVNLFGGQATLTPIAQSSVKNTPSPFAPQYPSLFPPPSTNETKTVLTVPVVQTPTISAPSITPKPTAPVPSDPIPSSITKFNQPGMYEDLTPTEVTAVDLRAEEEAERIFSQMNREECVFLESEVKAVLHQGRNMKLNLGTDNDKTRIVENTKSLEDFFREVVEICVSQNAEIHILKQNLLQSWAWYEEAKSRYLASEDESTMILIRSQPLDSASEKQRADIQHSNYYLESQISQAHIGLDEQWEQFQDYCKKTHKIQIPTMEMIFQTLVKQNAILRKQSYVLKDIGSRIKSKSRSAVGPSLLRSVDAAKDLPDELQRLRMNPEDITQIQYQHVTNRMKNFTQKKADNLRSFLKKREYSHISVIKPQISTSIIQASPSSRLKLHSWSAPRTPPVVKELHPKKLDFIQSTPKPTITKSEPIINIPSSTPIEGLQNFALKFEAKHFLNDKTFTPLTKGTIASSPNSAFVSTSFGSSTSASSAIPSKPTFMGMASTTTAPKTTPSYVMGTTLPEANQPVLTISVGNLNKPFSFTSGQDNVTIPPKPNSSVFANAVAQSASPFNLGGVSTTNSIFGGDANAPNAKMSSPSFNAAISKTSSIFNVTPSTKSAVSANSPDNTTVKTAATSSLIFGNATTSSITTTPSFAFGASSGSSIFGSGTQKSEPPVATTKPFAFAAPTQSLFAPKVGSSNVTAPLPATKDTSTSIFATAAATKAVTQAAATAPMLSVAPISSAQPSTVTVTAAATTPLGGVKPPVASVVSNSAAVIPSAAVAAAISIAMTASAATVNTSTVASTTTTASIFGSQATTKSSIFGSGNTTVSSTPTVPSKPLFGSSDVNTPKPSIFGNPTTTASLTSTTQPSVFGAVVTSTPQPPLFGSTASTTSPVATTQSSIFSNTSTPSTTAGFGTVPTPTTQSSIFGTTPSTSVAFGTVATPTTQSSIFNTTASTSSVFGTLATSTTQSTIFGSAPTASTTSLFGAPIASTAQSVFGGAPNQPSVFASAATSAPQSIFGQSSATTTTQPQGFGMFGDQPQKSSVFGNATTTAAQSSVFGNATTTAAQSSVFGSTNTPSSVFGNTTSSSNSIFGQTQASNTNSFGQSAFGASGNSFAGSNAFGGSSQTFGQNAGSVFGAVPTTSSGSIFGSTPAAGGGAFPPGTNVFGATGSSAPSPFGSSNVFASNTTQQSSFPAKTSTGSFGFGGLSVGATAPTSGSSSGFGSAATVNPFGGDNKNVFGSPATSPNNPVFGPNSASLFGTPAQSQGFASSGGFGSGSQPPFGQQSSFGQNSFGSGSFGQAPAGPFSNGSTAGVGQTGFGTSSSFQKPAGFGGSPVFGGSPAFGSAPSFGGAPAFGSSPTFGGSPKVFGAASPGFGGAPSPQAAGFGNLANQPTVGFGNLAQQAATASPNAPFSGNSSFSSWR